MSLIKGLIEGSRFFVSHYSEAPKGPWIATACGVPFDLVDPRPEHVLITDIAIALSGLCRYTGHLDRHYSVAQHSVIVSHMVPKKFALCGLLHDGHEAYTGDISKPLKACLGEAVRSVEKRVQNAVARRFDLPLELPAAVKDADVRMLVTERHQLMPAGPDWGIDVAPYDIWIDPMSREDACKAFLQRFHELYPGYSYNS